MFNFSPIKSLLKELGLIVLGGAIIFGLMSIPGCQTTPVKENYPLNLCFMLADSGYREMPKGVQTILANGCVGADKEARAGNRLVTCEKNWKKWKFSSQRECQLYLDPK